MLSFIRRKLHERKAYRCYWLTIHFASAEELAGFYLRHSEELQKQRTVRQLRGGEKVPLCMEDS